MSKSSPQRLCIGCRQMKEKKELIRIVKTPDGLCVDPTGKANGRGAYLCRNEACLAMALKNHGLARSFHTGIGKEEAGLLAEEMKKAIEAG